MTTPAATEVLVVVDPVAPGGALASVRSGRLADEVGRRATAECGTLLPLLAEPSVAEAARALVQRLRAGDGPLALVDAAFVSVPTLYGDVVAEPGDEERVLRDVDGHVMALRVPGSSRDALADAMSGSIGRASAQRLLDQVAELGSDLGWRSRALQPGNFPCAHVNTAQAAQAAVDAADAVDEQGLRLRRASRSDDGFLSTFLVRPLSRRITRLVVRTTTPPARVTAVALALGLGAALAYGSGTRWGVVLGSVLLFASLVTDCVDGEVARYTRRTSPQGGWLDVGADRVKEYAVYAGLAVGAVDAAGSARTAWLLALASMSLLVTRHFVDFGFGARQRSDGSPARSSGAVQTWSARTNARAGVRYAKRAVIAPVGERTIVLAVLAPTVGVRATFVTLLILGSVAAIWTTAGRVGRALATPAVGRRFTWLLPALTRAVEHAGSILLVAWAAPAALPWLFAWLAVLAIAQYDLTYRARLTGAAAAVGKAGRLARAGWIVRLALLGLVVSLVTSQAGLWLAVGAIACAVAALVSSVRFWAGRGPRRDWIPRAHWVPSSP